MYNVLCMIDWLGYFSSSFFYSVVDLTPTRINDNRELTLHVFSASNVRSHVAT